MEMGEFRHPVYTLDSKADINYGEAQHQHKMDREKFAAQLLSLNR
jgi:hypothetical protein